MKRRYQIDQQRAVQQFRQLAREENPNMPSERHPGEQISGTLVTNPKDYADVPALEVITLEVPLRRGRDDKPSWQGVIVDTGDGHLQPGGAGFTVRVPSQAKDISIAIKRDDDPAVNIQRDIPVAWTLPVSLTPAPRTYETSPICTSGVQVIRGPLSGDSHSGSVEVGGRPGTIVAENPHALYWLLPAVVPAGRNQLILRDGSSQA